MDYTYLCPYCGKRLEKPSKNYTIDMTGEIVDQLDPDKKYKQLKMEERLKKAGGFCKPHKPKPYVKKDEITDKLDAIKKVRSFNKLDELIEDAKSLPEKVVFNGNTVDYRCCPDCLAKIPEAAGKFKNETLVIMGEPQSYKEKFNMFERIDALVRELPVSKESEAAERPFASRVYELNGNKKDLLLNIVKIDERVLWLNNNDAFNEKKRIENILENADAFWMFLDKDDEMGLNWQIENAIKMRKYFQNKRGIICYLSDEEIKPHPVRLGDVYSLYFESNEAAKRIKRIKRIKSKDDKELSTLIDATFKELFLYYGKEEELNFNKTKMAFRWLMYLDGMRKTEDEIYIGKNGNSREKEAEYKLYHNLTKRSGFII